MMFKFYFGKGMRLLSAAVACAAFAAACGDGPDEGGDPSGTPSVKLEAGVSDQTSLTFTVTPVGADRCAYVCIPASAQAPAPDEILNAGKPVEADGRSTETVTGLEPVSGYVILAVAARGETVGKVVRLEMTTSGGSSGDMIIFGAAGKNTYGYSIAPAAGTAGYLHAVVRKDALDKLLGSLSSEDEKSAARLELLSAEGIAGSGEQSYEYTDGQVLSTPAGEKRIEILAGTDYVILAAPASGDKASGPVAYHTFRTEEPGRCAGKVDISLENTMDASLMRIICVPSSDLTYYYVAVAETSAVEALLAESGEAGLREYVFSEGRRAEGPDDCVKSGLETAASYTVAAVGVDASGDQTLCRSDFSTFVRVRAYVYNFWGHLGEFSYNTVYYDIYGHGITFAMRGLFLTSDVQKRLAEGQTYESICKTYGKDDFDPIDYEQVNSPAGATIWFHKDCEPETSYTVIIYVEDANGNRGVAVDEVTTTAVPDPDAILRIEAYTTDLLANQELYPYNSVVYDIHARNPKHIMHGCFLTSDVESELSEGMDYTDIIRQFGLDNFTADDYYLAGIPEGSQYWATRGCEPLTSYTVIVYAENDAGETATEHAEVTTAAAPLQPSAAGKRLYSACNGRRSPDWVDKNLKTVYPSYVFGKK